MLDRILNIVVEQTTHLGYREDAIKHDYAYSDIWAPTGGTRSVPLVAFTQTPPSYRSAAFAVAEGSVDAAQNLVENHRALGAPLFFVIEGDNVSSWQVYAKKSPRFLDRFAISRLPEVFHRHRDDWAPDVIHRAKSIGRVDGAYQLDFVDIGLIPAIEGEIHVKLDRLIREAVVDSRNVNNDKSMRLLFRGVFRLLAAKILTDRQHERAQSWNADNVADVLSAMNDYYRLGEDTQIWPRNTLALLEHAWAAFRAGFNVANISADDLAYVYETTLVTPQARADFGTHSTPRHVADYIVDRFRLWEYGVNPPKVYEPFAGAGVFLGSALRHMRDGLPHDWTDKQRHDLLIQHVGGAEIDPFACEVAKLSLILADYPNKNGWQIEEVDLFSKGTLAQRLEGIDVILCNPPFQAFKAQEREAYPDAGAIDGSKAVFALETSLRSQPKMLGFVVPNTLLVDRRYRSQRRRIEELYRDIELVSLPDGVFNASQLDTALLIARELRQSGETQRIRSSAVYDADKRRFAVNHTVSHTMEEVRASGFSRDGELWLPPLHHVWTALATLPKLGKLVRGHWGLRWHGGQKNSTRVFDLPGRGRALGYMDSSALDQFVLHAPRFLDVRPEGLLAGGNYDWDAPKILSNAGRLSRGYWRLAAAVDRDGRRASQQFIALWPNANVGAVDLDALVALLNGPVISAFVAEHSFDKRFRIGMLENAPIPAVIPERLGDLSRTYAALASRRESSAEDLARLLAEIDALTVGAYSLDEDLKRDLYAALGDNERPLRGLATRRRRSKKRPDQDSRKSLLPLFSNDGAVEEDIGEDLGGTLSPDDAADQLRSISRSIPTDQWAGKTLLATELYNLGSIRPRDLDDWIKQGRVIFFSDESGVLRFPVEQFECNEPLAGLDEIMTIVGDPRVAWLWLHQPHILLERHSPLEILKQYGIERLRSLVMRDFR